MSSGYQLSPLALIDLEEILRNRAEHTGEEAAEQLEGDMLSAFSSLAITPGLGHRRSDLTPRPFFFYTLQPYLIIYARHIEPLPIIAIFHASRNVKKLMKKRSI